jgi:methionyl-tRNA formyltransferase
MTQSLRLVFMGTPEFSVPVLERLIQSSHQVVAVYSQPPRPSGRGHQVQKSPVQCLAESHSIPVFTPLSLKPEEEKDLFRSHQADLAVVIAYGLLLPKAILDAPRYGCLNVHASLLPRWRGAAPIQRAIEAGDTETGITIMKMDVGLDTGPMLLTAKQPITLETTSPLLHDQLSHLGADIILEAIKGYTNETLMPEEQPSDGVTYAHKLTKEEGFLDWEQSADALERKIRALNPWPGTWMIHQGTKIKIQKAVVVPSLSPSSPGLILDDSLTISCGEKALRILKLQRPGGSALDTEDFLRGYPIPQGTLLECPATN